MRRMQLFSLTAGLAMAAAVAGTAAPVQAQNDWQYPDPYFGILEIEKSHDRGTARRYRAEVNPAPRTSQVAAPAGGQAPAGEPTVAPSPAPRPRWRNRWRR